MSFLIRKEVSLASARSVSRLCLASRLFRVVDDDGGDAYDLGGCGDVMW
jgi:hypothetical protein